MIFVPIKRVFDNGEIRPNLARLQMQGTLRRSEIIVIRIERCSKISYLVLFIEVESGWDTNFPKRLTVSGRNCTLGSTRLLVGPLIAMYWRSIILMRLCPHVRCLKNLWALARHSPSALQPWQLLMRDTFEVGGCSGIDQNLYHPQMAFPQGHKSK